MSTQPVEDQVREATKRRIKAPKKPPTPRDSDASGNIQYSVQQYFILPDMSDVGLSEELSSDEAEEQMRLREKRFRKEKSGSKTPPAGVESSDESGDEEAPKKAENVEEEKGEKKNGVLEKNEEKTEGKEEKKEEEPAEATEQAEKSTTAAEPADEASATGEEADD